MAKNTIRLLSPIHPIFTSPSLFQPTTPPYLYLLTRALDIMQTQALVIRDITSRSPRRWRPRPKWSRSAVSPSQQCKNVKVKQEIPEPVSPPSKPEPAKEVFSDADSKESPVSPSSTNLVPPSLPLLEPPTPVKPEFSAAQPNSIPVKSEVKILPAGERILSANPLNGAVRPARSVKDPDEWSCQYLMDHMSNSGLKECLLQADAPVKLVNFVVEQKITGRHYLLHTEDRGPLPKFLSGWDKKTSKKFVEDHLRNIVVNDHLAGYAPYSFGALYASGLPGVEDEEEEEEEENGVG